MRAKFTISSVKITKYAEELEFHPSYTGSKEDNSYSEATPSASLVMTVSNKELHGKFKPGQSFYVDFTPVE